MYGSEKVKRVDGKFVIRESALKWFRSYLTRRANLSIHVKYDVP